MQLLEQRSKYLLIFTDQFYSTSAYGLNNITIIDAFELVSTDCFF